MTSQALLSVLNGEKPHRRPIWFMRQAGRYLPEYLAVRQEAGSFLDLCYNPTLAREVTLQPLRRFDLDAAILFADILLIPDALGLDVKFVKNEGPVLGTIRNSDDVAGLKRNKIVSFLNPVFDTVSAVRAELDDHIALIGFCGAPWTVATYMIEGGTSRERQNAKLAAYRNEEWFADLIEILVISSIDYLEQQVKAGAQALQIFDSWAGDLDGVAQCKWVNEPIKQIVSGLRERGITVPIIGFARGVGAGQLEFAKTTEVNCIGVESSLPVNIIRDKLIPHIAVQGNLDPLAVIAGGQVLEERVAEIITEIPVERHIFNLGHGFKPETPIDHVSAIIEQIRRAE